MSGGKIFNRDLSEQPDGSGSRFRCTTGLALVGHLRNARWSDAWRGVQVVGSNGPIVGVPRVPFEFRRAGSRPVVGLPNTALYSNRNQQFHRRSLDERGEATDWIWLRPSITAEIVREFDPDAPDNEDDCHRFADGRVSVADATRLRVLVAYARAARSPDPLLLEETIVSLLAAFVRSSHAARQVGRARRRRASTERAHRAAVEHVKLVIAQRCTELLSLEQVAREACLSPHHFCRVFRQHTGLTIHSAVTELRILKAVEAFEQQDENRLTSLGLRLGFSSGAHFASVMSSRLGIRSRDLRRTIRSLNKAQVRTILKDLSRAARDDLG